MTYKKPGAWFGAIAPMLHRVRRSAAAAAIALFLCLTVLPAYAHDDDAPARPPSADEKAAAARTTIAIFSLVTGVAVYYGMQRHRLVNSSQHTPEWDKTMNRNAILFALIAAVAVGGVCAALSRPTPTPTDPQRPVAPPSAAASGINSVK